MILPLPPVPPVAPAYRLVWSDEFDRPGRPDPRKWTYETGFVRNRELQWYAPENASVAGGRLILEARRERRPNPTYVAGSADWRAARETIEYTSACVRTKGLRAWRFGRFEVRARFRAERGLWPAIWTLGSERPWPANGEIDLFEYYGHAILANTAYGESGGSGTVWNSVEVPYAAVARDDVKWDARFHTWRMDWDETTIRLYLDDRLLNETDVRDVRLADGFRPFHQPHDLLLNLAVGSNGGDPRGTRFPARFEVDWVRVSQRK